MNDHIWMVAFLILAVLVFAILWQKDHDKLQVAQAMTATPGPNAPMPPEQAAETEIEGHPVSLSGSIV